MLQPFVWRVMALAMLASFFQQFSGIMAFMYYGSKLGSAIGVDGSIVQVMINAVNSLAVIPAFFIVVCLLTEM